MKISVIGFGYIGSVISAVLSSKGHNVSAIDKNQACIDDLNNGICNVPEPLLKEMVFNSVNTNLLKGSTSYDGIEESNVVLVTVGTSLSEEYDADLSALNEVFENLSHRIVAGQVIMIKSTVPPGVTRKLYNDYLGERSDIFMGFSPERLAEGNAIQELNELPIVVGGINEQSLEKCSKFWIQTLGVSTIKVSSCEAAELVKLADNQWIDLNIALANEFAKLCDALPYKIDVLEVIKGANSLKKGQHYVNFLTPSIGVGGYCLTKDPWFVSTLGEKNQSPLQLPRAGREVNDSMPSYCAAQIMNSIEHENNDIENAKIAILGYSFKSNSGDIRFSPMIKFTEALLKEGFNKIEIFDPTIESQHFNHDGLKRVNSWEECVKNSDFVVFGAAHDDIISIQINDLIEIMDKNATILDGRRYFTKEEINKIKKSGLKYIGIGRKF